MDNNNNLASKHQNSQVQQRQTDFKKNVNIIVGLVFIRSREDANDPYVKVISDYISENKSHIPLESIKEACKKGVGNEYGRPYGKMKLQDVCYWIDRYVEENPNASMDNENYVYYQWMDDPSVIVRRVLKTEAEEMFKGQETAGYTYKVIKNIKNKNKTWN